MSNRIIGVTRKDFEELKELYKNCKADSFMFRGREILKQYAKYMIEYLEIKFGNEKD